MAADAITDSRVAADVLPFPNRKDWNSFCLSSKKIHNFVKETATCMLPWPEECVLKRGKDASSNSAHDPHWSPCGTQIIFRQNREVSIFDCKRGLLPERLSHNEWVCSLAFSPDGQFLVTASSEDGCVKMWKTKSYEFIKEWKVFTHLSNDESDRYLKKGLVSVAVSPCSQKIVVLERQKAFIFGVKDDVPTSSFQLHDGRNVLFSKNGKSLILDDQGVITKLWKPETNETLNFSTGGWSFPIESIDMSPDGSKLMTFASWGAEVKIWNLDTDLDEEHMLQLSQVIPAGSRVTSAVFAPNGDDALLGFNGFHPTGKKGYIVAKLDGSESWCIDSVSAVDVARFSPKGGQVVTGEEPDPEKDGTIRISRFLSVQEIKEEKKQIEEQEECLRGRLEQVRATYNMRRQEKRRQEECLRDQLEQLRDMNSKRRKLA